MKKIYILIILTALILSVFIIGSYFKNPFVKIEQNQSEQKIIINPCKGVSETECFARLSNCLEANSTGDFLNKIGEDQANKLTNKVTPPLKTNFPNAEIFLIMEFGGGGDYYSLPFIKLGDKYCKLTENNSKMVFSPIKNKEDALKYYFFIRRDLGSARSQTIVYILNEDDYQKTEILRNAMMCNESYKEKLKNRITEIEDLEDGYLITFIAFEYMGEIEFFESKIKIKFDGTVEEISKNALLDCGIGYVF